MKSRLCDRGASSEQGFTLMEMIVVVFITSFMVIVLAMIFQKVSIYLRQSSVKSQLQIEAMSASDSMVHFLERGQAYSLIITQQPNTPPYSEIDFIVNDSSSTNYKYYLASPAGTGLPPYQLVMTTQVGVLPVNTMVLSTNAFEFGVSCPDGCGQNPHLLDLKLTLQKGIDSLHTVTVPVLRQSIPVLAN